MMEEIQKPIAIRIACFLLMGIAISGCGGGSGGTSPGGGGVKVSISPRLAYMTNTPGSVRQFKATVTGIDNQEVDWSIQPTDAGSITADGKFTPSLDSTVVTVNATSKADPTKKATASIRVARDADWLVGNWQGTISMQDPSGENPFFGEPITIFINDYKEITSPGVCGYSYGGTLIFNGNTYLFDSFDTLNPDNFNKSLVWGYFDQTYTETVTIYISTEAGVVINLSWEADDSGYFYGEPKEIYCDWMIQMSFTGSENDSNTGDPDPAHKITLKKEV